MADNEEGVDLSAEDFVDRLWLLSITLLPIMVSGEELVERGRREKLRKPKSGYGKQTEFWSPFQVCPIFLEGVPTVNWS